MGDKSAIQWTDATWNPLIGCTKVSAGCTYCYAITTAARNARFPAMAATYAGLVTEPHADGSRNWTGTVKFLPERLDHPLRWARPRRIFVNSMSDLYHEGITDEQIAQVYAVMAACPQHTFQVLTKRPERRRDLFRDTERWRRLMAGAFAGLGMMTPGASPDQEWPLLNVWEGTSVEDQAAAEQRIPALRDTPAAVRFLSMEPLLGPVDLRQWLGGWSRVAPWLHWVIVGGESGGPEERRLVRRCTGHGQRDPAQCPLCHGTGWVPKLDLEIAVGQIRDVCQEEGVAFLFKQWGGPTHGAGGRLLDGRYWDQYPDGRGGLVEQLPLEPD